MPFPTGMNNQESEAVAEISAEVVALSPAIAAGNLYITTSQALGMAAMNAVQAQQQDWMLSRAALSQEVVSILYNGDLEMTELAKRKDFA